MIMLSLTLETSIFSAIKSLKTINLLNEPSIEYVNTLRAYFR